MIHLQREEIRFSVFSANTCSSRGTDSHERSSSLDKTGCVHCISPASIQAAYIFHDWKYDLCVPACRFPSVRKENKP